MNTDNSNKIAKIRQSMRGLIKSRADGEMLLHDLNALLQNALRAPIDHREVREILWAACDVESAIIALEIKAAAPKADLHQDSVFLRTTQ